MRVLVTGAGGFIGSHLVEDLVRQGHSVRALVRYNSSGHTGWLKHVHEDVRGQFETVFGDVRDIGSIDVVTRNQDSIMNLAALIGIPYSYDAPGAYVETNIGGTLNLLQSARRNGVDRFIQTSTSEVYGSAQTVPIDESHPIVGQSPYAATKIGSDELALSFHKSFELPVVLIRPFNAYGPRQSMRAVIPSVVVQALSNKKKIKMGSMTPTRDFNFVKDTVGGFVCALGASACVGETINLGTGHEVSIQEMVEIVSDTIGREIEIEQDQMRLRPAASEVDRLVADNTKAKRLLGWTPNYAGDAGFRRGIEEVVTWYSNPENLEHYDADPYWV